MIYCYRDIKFVISWYKILVISPTPSWNYIKLALNENINC